jgi:hypothetical protein
LTNWTATRIIKADEDFTLTWDAFQSGASNDFVGVAISTLSTNILFQTPDFGHAGALDGRSTSTIIPMNVLALGQEYIATIIFSRTVSLNTTNYPNAIGFTSYARGTGFKISAIAPETGAGQLQFSSARYSINEDGGDSTITVVRTVGSTGAVSVDFATAGGSAIAGMDYTTISGTLNFTEGQTSKTFTVPILDDPLAEKKKTIGLHLSNPTGGATLHRRSAKLTIFDND